jgi:Na+/H+ antiporter NhaD/arsenite permease-like protein
MDGAAVNPENLPFAQAGLGQCLLYFAPFAILLGMVAILPLMAATEAWWGKNGNKALVAGLCSAAGVVLYLGPTGDWAKLLDTLLEYLTFMALLGSLYVVCGGIHIVGTYSGTPGRNVLFLLGGAVLANLMGTTGASMILIRPLLRANRHRHDNAHIVIFFIFIVSNAGGLLTPLGDPPLYLGFLQGVPFAWTFRLLPQWTFLLTLVLGVFYLVDGRYFARESKELRQTLDQATPGGRGIQVEGWRNVLFLFALLGVILASGYIIQPAFSRLYGAEVGRLCSEMFQIVLMIGIALMSFDLTAPHMYKVKGRIISAYANNDFTTAAIIEVGILFFGIFGAMLPTLAVLQAKGPSLGVEAPWQYFWGSGTLSSFLDNAPTYLTFATLAASKSGVSLRDFSELAARFPRLLEAVACGSVFMGANSYIGNGPNFMVKAIADHSKVKMPSFFGYMLWSMAVLVPIFVIETLVFFR